MSQVQTFYSRQPFELESGAVLPELHLAYQTWGDPEASKVIWVCHALTGNSDCVDWWPGLFEAGGIFDPQEYYIICANMLGSCYGSTSPVSVNPQTDQPWYQNFPTITNRDIVKGFDLLREHLQISQIHVLIGGSLGGQQAIEWAIWKPVQFSHLVALCTNAQHSPWGIAFNESQRMAISTDPSWGESHAEAGRQGLKTARSIAMLSYRHYHKYEETQSEQSDEQLGHFRAASYQQYQGQKFTNRFNAYSYWHLSQSMDSHNVGRGRQSITAALSQISARTLVIGITTDILFPVQEQQLLARLIPAAHYRQIDSTFGHDGFLVETSLLTEAIRHFLEHKPQSVSSN